MFAPNIPVEGTHQEQPLPKFYLDSKFTKIQHEIEFILLGIYNTKTSFILFS